MEAFDEVPARRRCYFSNIDGEIGPSRLIMFGRSHGPQLPAVTLLLLLGEEQHLSVLPPPNSLTQEGQEWGPTDLDLDPMQSCRDCFAFSPALLRHVAMVSCGVNINDAILILGVDENLGRGISNGKFGGRKKDTSEYSYK